MKALLGLDAGGTFRLGLDLLRRLKFPDTSLRLVAMVEPVIADTGLMTPDGPSLAPDLLSQLADAARHLLREVAEEAKPDFAAVDAVLAFGSAFHEIERIAQEWPADLVVTGSERKGWLESLILGSVTRGLALSGRHSVLIGKEWAKDGGLTAVLATDHSPYLEQCLASLARTPPQGIDRLIVVTAYELDDQFPATTVPRQVVADDTPPEEVAVKIVERSAALCRTLEPIGAQIEPRAVQGDPDQVIADTMEEEDADLLILGAQGHNFVKRVLAGSTALHFVTREPYNLLLLRPDG